MFACPSRRLYEKGGKKKVLSEDELHKPHTYVLLNCVELTSYIIEFDGVAEQIYIGEEVSSLRDKYFAQWFAQRVSKTK